MIRKPIAATGRLIQKITRQSRETRNPPSSGPIARARAETPAQIPSALGCSERGKASQTIARESGSIAAAPTPWTTRPATSITSPWAAPESAEPAANAAVPARKTALRPNMSPSRPAVTTKDRDHQQVGVHHPLEAGRGGADVVLDRGERQRHHGRVEHQQEEAEAGARQGPPRPGLLVEAEHLQAALRSPACSPSAAAPRAGDTARSAAARSGRPSRPSTRSAERGPITGPRPNLAASATRRSGWPT